MKPHSYIALLCFILSAGCVSNTKAADAKEVYNSGGLVVVQLSDDIFIHISYLEADSFGRVPCNGMIVTHGGKTVVFDTTVDDSTSADLIEWITHRLGSNIIAVVPTHYHADNLGGLEEFHRRGIASYSLNKTIAYADSYGLTLPHNGFDNFVEFDVGGRKVYAEYFGEGHTADNFIGYYPAEKTMFGGCLVKAQGSGKGNLDEANPTQWPSTLRKLKKKYRRTKIVVPGHGDHGGWELLDYTIRLFE